MADAPLTPPASVLQWAHADARGLDEAIPQAIARAKAREWSADASAVSHGTRAADLRALLVASAYMRAELSSDRPSINPKENTVLRIFGEPSPLPSTDAGRRAAMALLPRTWSVILGTDDPRFAVDFAPNIRTIGSEGGVQDAGWIIAVTAIVAGAVAVTAIYVYAAQKAAEVIDRKLSRDADTARLLDTHARTLEVLDAHSKSEAAAGKVLPLTDAEKQVLGTLGAAQTEILKKREQPIASPLPDAAKGFGLGVLFAAAVAAYVVLSD